MPFALWLMAEGLTHEDATLALVAKSRFVAKRQDVWIGAVARLRTCVYHFAWRKS